MITTEQENNTCAEHYSIEPMPTQQDYGYPYNMVLAMWDMDTKMKRSLRNWDGFKLILDSKKTFLTSEERYDTGTTLFYIPIVPLFEMLHDKQRKHTAHLLTSVCSYLYHIARIPYYRQEDSYLYWLYETHKDWIDNDDETEETESYKNELRKAETIGDKIEQKLYNRINLTVFEQRLSRFKSRDTFDHECWKVACNAFALYTETEGKLDAMFLTGTFKNGEQLLSEIVLTRDPRLYEHCMVNGLPKMLDWSAGTMSGLPYELWVGGYDEGQNAALESGNYATGYKNMKYYLGTEYQRQYTHWVYLRLSDIYLTYAEALLQAKNDHRGAIYNEPNMYNQF
jgi:hypothetical protein